MHEEPGRIAVFYPLSTERMDVTYLFREDDLGRVDGPARLSLLRRKFAGAGWITESVLVRESPDPPAFFDSLTQIIMPRWWTGRICLIGEACGCLTLAAGQGSHMAMAGTLVLATELARHPGDHEAAFAAYESFLKPHVDRKQAKAAQSGRLDGANRTFVAVASPHAQESHVQQTTHPHDVSEPGIPKHPPRLSVIPEPSTAGRHESLCGIRGTRAEFLACSDFVRQTTHSPLKSAATTRIPSFKCGMGQGCLRPERSTEGCSGLGDECRLVPAWIVPLPVTQRCQEYHLHAPQSNRIDGFRLGRWHSWHEISPVPSSLP